MNKIDERIRDMATTAIARETAQREAIATRLTAGTTHAETVSTSALTNARLTREGLRHFLAQTDLVAMTDLVEGTPR